MELYIIHQRFSVKGNDYYNEWNWYFTDYEKAWKFYVKSVKEWENDPLHNGFKLTCDTDCGTPEYQYYNMEYTNGNHKVSWTFNSAHTMDERI